MPTTSIVVAGIRPEGAAGTEADPYGINHLVTAAGRPGVALDRMAEGDALWLDGDSGTFDVPTEAIDNYSYNYGVLAPAAVNCTIRSKPGTVAVVRRTGGLCPLAGPLRRDAFVAHGTRWLALEFRDAEVPGKKQPLVRIVGKTSGTEITYADDCEVGWCRLVGSDIPGEQDNHDGIRWDYSRRAWVHDCEIVGFTGSQDAAGTKGGHNNAGLKSYSSGPNLFERNYVHGNNCGVFDKHGPLGNVYRLNLVIDNFDTRGGGRNAFNSTEYGPDEGGGLELAENVLDQHVKLWNYSSRNVVHHNLIYDADALAQHGTGESATPSIWQHTYANRFHSNVVLSSADAAKVVNAPYITANGPATNPVIAQSDYNVFASLAGGTPSLKAPSKDNPNRTLAQWQAMGFDTHSTVVPGGPAALFDDPAAYALKAAYLTAGKDGSKPGPADPAAILGLAQPGGVGPELLLSLESPGTPAVGLVLSGPSTGQVGEPAGPYSVAPDGAFSGTVTPSDGGAGGTFSPVSRTWSGEPEAKSFTYTPASAGTVTISLANDAGLTDPAPISLLVVAAVPPVPVPARRLVGVLAGPALYMFADMVRVRRKTAATGDPSGIRRDSYTADAEAVPAYVQDATPQAVPDLMVVGSKVNTVVYFPADPATEVGDLLDVLGAEAEEVARTLVVVRTRREGLAPGYLWRVDCTARD